MGWTVRYGAKAKTHCNLCIDLSEKAFPGLSIEILTSLCGQDAVSIMK